MTKRGKGSLLVTILVLTSLALFYNNITQSYAQFQNWEDIDLEILGGNKIESENSDVIVFRLSFNNIGNSPLQILVNTVFLEDSQGTEHSVASYLDLRDKGHSVSSKDCPFVSSINVGPGLSEEENFCYEVPKGIGASYAFKLYESLPENCEEPLFDCTIKTISFEYLEINGEKPEPPAKIPEAEVQNLTEEQSTEPEPKIPNWIRNIFIWYAEDRISEDELLGAIQFLIQQGIIKV